MIANSQYMDLIPDWSNHIAADGARDAFFYLIGWSASLKSFNCFPKLKGVNGPVRGFHFVDRATGDEPFALIVNKGWLLFYLRKPVLRQGRYSFEVLSTQFDSANVNPAGEWTVKLGNVEDVRRLRGFLRLE